MASAMTGVGVALASYAHHASIPAALLYGVAGVAVHVTAFGLDPMRDKRMEGIDTFHKTSSPTLWTKLRRICC